MGWAAYRSFHWWRSMPQSAPNLGSMAETEPLDVYLNDHLAGSAAAVELVERIRANNEGTALAAHMDGLRLRSSRTGTPSAR